MRQGVVFMFDEIDFWPPLPKYGYANAQLLKIFELYSKAYPDSPYPNCYCNAKDLSEWSCLFDNLCVELISLDTGEVRPSRHKTQIRFDSIPIRGNIQQFARWSLLFRKGNISSIDVYLLLKFSVIIDALKIVPKELDLCDEHSLFTKRVTWSYRNQQYAVLVEGTKETRRLKRAKKTSSGGKGKSSKQASARARSTSASYER
jgi:hypothetical protein